MTLKNLSIDELGFCCVLHESVKSKMKMFFKQWSRYKLASKTLLNLSQNSLQNKILGSVSSEL